MKLIDLILKESNSYKEIEFVCSNSEYSDSTSRKQQLGLYKDLLSLQRELGYDILPYMEDWSDNKHKQYSLAVVLLDSDLESEHEKKIISLADKWGVEIDLYNRVSNRQVNHIIRKGNLSETISRIILAGLY